MVFTGSELVCFLGGVGVGGRVAGVEGEMPKNTQAYAVSVQSYSKDIYGNSVSVGFLSELC